MGESDLDQQIAPVYTKYTNPATTILAGAGDIHIHLRARCETAEQAEILLEEVAGPIEKILGDRIYSYGGESLEEIIGENLTATARTVCVAESCTGGQVAERITSVPGSSKYFLGGFLTYTDEVKTKLLGVSRDLLAAKGAVSEDAAREMAIGARSLLGTTFALSVTGFAGPDGGTEADPVGTVYIALASEGACDVRRIQFIGDRERVRMLAAQSALDLLRRKL
jgi:nicotinamide-nucleotide amidase